MLQDAMPHSVVSSGKNDASWPPPPLSPALEDFHLGQHRALRTISTKRQQTTAHHLCASTIGEMTWYPPAMPSRHRENIQRKPPGPTTAATPNLHSPAGEKRRGAPPSHLHHHRLHTDVRRHHLRATMA
jgi:hypothetical protein